MKKILFLVLMSLVWTVALMADPVTSSQAREKASQFLKKRVASHARRSAPIAVDLKMMAAGKDDSYYIFNVGDEGGYVVVSGDDATEEILGYSDTGSINPDNMPCGMRMLLDNYASQIQFLREKGITREQNGSTSNAPLRVVKTKTDNLAKFDQFNPYNLQCPEMQSQYSDHAATGCAATAMAELMYYHQWPNATIHDIPSYTSESKHFPISSIPSGTSLDWNLILQQYNSYDEQGNRTKLWKEGDEDEKATAVANLMKYVGTSLHMDYDEESGAYIESIPYALKQYFSYNSSAYYVDRKHFTYDEWVSKICDELQNRGPVIYCGTTSDKERHFFLIEEYSDNNLFLINFGWDNRGNDYFSLDLIQDPNGNIYKYEQGAVFDVSPNKTGTTDEIPLRLWTEYIKDEGIGVYERSTESGLFKGVSFSHVASNYIPLDATFDCAIAWDSNAQYYSRNTTIPAFSQLTISNNKIDIDFSNGHHLIRLLSCESGKGSLDVNDNTDYAFAEAWVWGDWLSIKSSESILAQLRISDLVQTSDATLRVGQPSEFKFSIINDANPIYDGGILIKDAETDNVIFIDRVQLNGNTSNQRTFSFTPTKSGEQELIFLNKRWEEIGRQTVYAIPVSEVMEVTNLMLMTGNFSKGLIDGTILSGTLYIKNNDVKTIEEEIIIGLEDVELPQANKTKSISVSINPNRTERYNIRFYNLTANHRYVITASHINGEEFYRSPELLCKTEYEPETYSSMYSKYQVLNVPYIKTNTSAFKHNEHTASDRINNVISQYLSNGIVAKKADLVGHSMGGILARLHVQYTDGGNENVHKVITVNTPHSGSPLGDLLGEFALKWGPTLDMVDNFQSEIVRKFYGYDSKDWHAVGDLGYDSDQTDEYLNNETVLDRMNNIPIHAIVTDVTGISTSDIEYLSSEDEKWLEFVRIAGKMGLNYVWNDNTDLVVSVQSQKGGLETPFISTIHDQWHVGSPNNKEVQDALISLLQESVESSRFCKNGFRPINLVYEDTGGSRTKERYSLVSESSSTLKHAPGVEPTVTALVNDNVITASMAGAEGYDYQLMLIQFGKDAYSMVSGTQIECEVPASFCGDATIYGIVRMEDKDIIWSKTQVNNLTPRASRTSISTSALSIYYDESQPVSLTCIWSDGSETHVIPDDITFTDRLAYYEDGVVTGLHGGSGIATFTYQGLTCEAPFTVYNFGKGDDGENSKSVCSTISLKLSQTMTMTRQAFRGTLTVFNGNETMSMKDVKLALLVTNKNTGEVATSHEFQINAESLDGFIGEVDLTSGWTLAGNTTGTATVLFIPTKYAAPTEPVEWSFGGTLSYLDPYTGLTVTRDLYPVTLTVKPSPELDLTYFMQRDVYGDDPLTQDVVEPIKPAEFALLINNKGYGDATNVKMVTQQPEIVDNQKGLAINFELISSQVNGADATLSFGQTISNDFGTIPAHSQMYAQWWLTSTLLGHFTDYDVHATHVTSYGNEDLSLLDEVTIHELIHGFDLSTNEQPLRAFLVNDLPDSEDLPDMLYLSNGETENVSIASSGTVERTSNTTCKLTIVPSASGWNYGNLLDPTHGMATIKSIVRQSDGKEIATDNFWQTDRMLRDGKDPLYENRLHFIDKFAGTGVETYVITFDSIPDVALEVESIEVVPEEGTVAVDPVETLTVTFNKPVAPETFTTDDLAFFVQGSKQDASLIGITTEDNKSFVLNLATVTEQCPNGYYTLTVQTADITDSEGYQGKTGKQVGWIMYRGGLVQLLTSAWPEKSGSVSRSTDEGAGARLAEPSEKQEDTAQYGSTVTFTAQPADGYEFSSWTLNGEEVSMEATYTATALSDMDVVAYFIKKTYYVDIDTENEGGSISGAGTGYYEHGSQLSLKAEPYEDFVMKEWNVNGETVPVNDGALNLTVETDQKIKAVFEREFYRQSIVLTKGWNWVSSYLNESLDIEPMSKYANRIVGQFDELIRDPQYGMVGGIDQLSSGMAYKVEADRAFTSSFRGHLYNTETSPIQLHKGWNWIAYPYNEQLYAGSVITNAEEGDYLVSQSGFTEFADGYWEGSLNVMVPGNGYLYKSVSEKTLSFEFSSGSTGSRSVSDYSSSSIENDDVDIYRYPNTMNMTIQIHKEDNSPSTEDYNIYAMVGEDLRGISQKIGENYYLTVYGDEPVEVSFAVESTTTGEVFVAPEMLTFRDDVVGSRKSPYVLHIGGSTGIDSLVDDGRQMTVYSLEGILVSRNATLKTLKKLPKGVYIVNGHKCFIK